MSVELAILDALKFSPLAAADLKEHVLKRVTGLKDKPYKGSLGALIAAKRIHGLPKVGKNGKPTRTIEAYGLGAPPPSPPPAPPPRERAPKEILELLKVQALSPGDLKERLKKSVPGLAVKDLNAVLAELVESKQIYPHPKRGPKGPTKTIEKYGLEAPPPPSPSPRERAPKEILELLKPRALSLVDLKERLKESIPNLATKDLTAILAELTKTNQIYGRRKKDKNGKATTTIESYAIGGAPVDEFILPVLATWKEMRREAAAAGVRDQALVAALLDGLARDGVSVGHASPPVTQLDDSAIVLRGVRELVAREGHGALIPIRKLRGALNLPKERFDAALLGLYSSDTLILHHHDYVGNLSDAERNELVLDRHGNYYIGVALRGDQ